MHTLPPFLATSCVALGGAAGAVLRYHTGRLLTGWLGAPAVAAFPFATLAVNALGSVLMGALAGWLALRGSGSGGGETLRLLLGVGLLGGYTTFSAFSLECALLIERGQAGAALLYAGLSLGLGIAGLFAGLAATRGLA